MWALYGRVRASKEIGGSEFPEPYSGQGIKNEVFVGGCDRTGWY